MFPDVLIRSADGESTQKDQEGEGQKLLFSVSSLFVRSRRNRSNLSSNGSEKKKRKGLKSRKIKRSNVCKDGTLSTGLT